MVPTVMWCWKLQQNRHSEHYLNENTAKNQTFFFLAHGGSFQQLSWVQVISCSLQRLPAASTTTTTHTLFLCLAAPPRGLLTPQLHLHDGADTHCYPSQVLFF